MLSSASSNRYIYRILLWLLLIAAVFVLLRLSPILTRPDLLPGDDFVRYWASGTLNLQGQNPFDTQLISHVQQELGGSAVWSEITSVTLTPPWVVSILMPLGALAYPLSRMIWLLVSVLILLLSSLLLWQLYKGKPGQRWMAILAAFIFAPSISILEKGQITSLALIGLAGFLYFAAIRRNDWLAGVSLALVAFKPQVILLFWLALIIWWIRHPRWVILLSACASVLILTLIAFAFNPHILSQYLTMLHTYGISDWANPTIGAYLRFFWLGTDLFWIQFLPTLLGAAWFLFYWRSHKAEWVWSHEIPLILFVSVITSPYAWTYDQVVLVPALVQAAAWVAEGLKNQRVILFSGIYLALNLLNLLLHMRLNDFWFIWFAPALLVWYLLLRRQYLLKAVKAEFSSITVG